MAKALSGGFIPVGGVAMTETVMDAVFQPDGPRCRARFDFFQKQHGDGGWAGDAAGD